MATIGENLIALENTKNNIKLAIESKGQDLTGVPFTEYPDKISAIETGGGDDMLQQMVDATNSCNYLFYKYQGANLDFINKLDVSNVTTMSNTFGSCQNLTSLDVSSWETKNVTDMTNMFSYCKITNLDLSGLDVDNVTTFYMMFNYCSALKSLNLSGWNTNKLISMEKMFYYCSTLATISGIESFNTSLVTSMNSLFHTCKALTNLDLSGWNISKVTNMGSLFYGCTALTNLDLSGWDTSKVTNMASMFQSCSKLTSINIDLLSATSVSNMFYGCTNLTDLYLKNIKLTQYIGDSSNRYGANLTNESLINTFKELWDLTGSTGQKLYISATSRTNIANIYVKLVDVTDEMLAQDQYAGNKKPCVVCESTDEGSMTLTEYATSKNWAIV